MDVLHAILLGNVKHLFITLTKEGYLSDDKFTYMQSIVDQLQLHLPDEVPGIIHKIGSKMSGVSALQVSFSFRLMSFHHFCYIMFIHIHIDIIISYDYYYYY